MNVQSSASTTSQTFSTNSFFTPLLISVMGIAVTALAILFYHLLLVRYCIRRHAVRMAALHTLAGEEIPAGVDEKTLLTIPIIKYKKTDNSVTDQAECAVCLGDVENDDMVRLLPNCKHFFHVKCIDDWFVGHMSCPVCRVPVVAPDDETRGCSVCRSVGTTVDDNDRSTGNVVEDGGDSCGGGFKSVPERIMLRHCNSLVLPGEKKERLTGMELKRSLSMGQSNCVVIDMNIDYNVNNYKDCTNDYSSFRDQSIRGFRCAPSKVRQSSSRMCVGQEQRSDIILC